MVTLFNGLFERKWTYLALFGGFFLIEVLLSPWTGHPYDMEVWFNTGAWMNQGINIYEPSNHLGYPPLWAFWCLIAYRFYSFFGNSTEVWRFIIKLPLMISHLALAYSVGKFATKEFGRKKGLEIFYIVLAWSFFIYIGALWGQINTLSALLTFLAFSAVVSQRTTLGALLFGIGVTLKIYPLIILPGLFAYVLKKHSKREAGKFLLYTSAVPILFTLSIFTVFRWDIVFFLRTIFFWTPTFESPVQITRGCMNLWSFLALFNVDMRAHWPLRHIWIVVLGAGASYWLKKSKLDKADLNLSLISLYILFMISYGWVTEQTFVDPLPFIFLQILAYRPKRSHLYMLVAIQILVYAFSAINGGVFIFEPLLERFSPALLSSIQYLDLINSPFAWTIRGTLGLIISLFLAVFLIILAKPNTFNSLLSILPSRLKRSRTIEEFADTKQMSV